MTVTLHQVPATAQGVWAHLEGSYRTVSSEREIAAALAVAHPVLSQLARENRAFTSWCVRWLAAERGLTRFLDLGAGPAIVFPDQTRLPLAHEIAREAQPAARAVYVDHAPKAVRSLGEAIGGQGGAEAILGDLSGVRAVLRHEAVRKLLRGRRPAAVILTAVLHYWERAEAQAIVDAYRDALPAGSAMVISTCQLESDAAIAERRGLLPGIPYVEHTPEAIDGFFAGLTVAPRPVGDVRLWPFPAPGSSRTGRIVGGIGIKG